MVHITMHFSAVYPLEVVENDFVGARDTCNCFQNSSFCEIYIL